MTQVTTQASQSSPAAQVALINESIPTFRISEVQFGILSPEEIIRLSVVEVTNESTFENGKPVLNGLNDPRMGVIELGERCKTCELDERSCPGHFGRIVLETPVFNPLFISGSRMGNSISIKHILECVCIKCAKLLMDPPSDISKIKKKKRLGYIKSKLHTVRKCESKNGCGLIQPKYSFDRFNNLKYSYGGRDTQKEDLRPEYVLNLFKRIDNSTIELFGLDPHYTRPEWMILTILPVIPPCVRPSIKSDNAKHEDDLVVGYSFIIKTNRSLRKYRETGNQKMVEETEKLLNIYMMAMFNGRSKGGSDIVTVFSTGGRVLKSIKEKLSSKDGRIRGNLNGKRVDFSARTVITPDPNLSVDQVGMPIEVATVLTFPTVVSQENMEECYRLLYNGPDKYPGANRITQLNGSTRVLKYVDVKNIVLQPGDVIERHIQDDDIVLFNRQPSLHKMSMMAHRVVVLPERTFRMNPSACNPYNADFDGLFVAVNRGN